MRSALIKWKNIDLESESIPCKICGTSKKSLIGHLSKKHGLSVFDYRKKFGWDTQTVSGKTLLKMKESAEKHFNQEDKERLLKYQELGHQTKANFNSCPTCHRRFRVSDRQTVTSKIISFRNKNRGLK